MERKARGRPKRSWVKMDCQGCLHGSINFQLTLEEQAIWYKLIMYSAVCGGEPGFICDNDSQPMPLWYIANELHCPLETLEGTLKKCTQEGRTKVNSSGIEIVNFNAYQFTEYDRQRPSREKARKRRTAADVPRKTCPECHYVVEESFWTKDMEICPQCNKKGNEVRLVPYVES